MIPSNHLVVRETRASRGESNEGVFTDRGRCETRQPMAQTTQFVGSPALDSLQMTGLMLAWLLTYLIVCAVNGSVPSVERAQKDVPSHVLSFGGVFGMHRPMVEIVWRTTCAGLLGMGALLVCDILYARRTKARWFALHVIANAWIAILCVPDLCYVISRPIEALTQTSVNHWPTSLVFSVHVYHMVFFRGLQWVDWLHHILMVVIGAPLMVTSEVGPLMNFNHFFMCGVPGGLDYAMLFAVKHGWMEPLQEKRHNLRINVWIRAPMLVCTAVLAMIQVHLQDGIPRWVSTVRILLCALAVWNGLFFMERVVGNYHVCAYKARLAKKSSDAAATTYDTTYTTEEHMSAGVPGMGVRISVSTQDLQKIESDHAKPE